MNCSTLGSLVLSTAAFFGFAALSSTGQSPPQQEPPKPAPAPEQKPKEKPEEQRLRDPSEPFRFSGFPSADKEKSAKRFEPVVKWLNASIGRPIVFVPVESYASAVTLFSTNKVDMIWVDGIHAALAEEATKNRCQPIVARQEDFKTKSYFIAAKKLVDEGKFKSIEERAPMTIDFLAALKPRFAELKFTFGDKLSTPSHVMPRFFLEHPDVGIEPEKGFCQKPGYAASGGDASVIASVMKGTFDVGVVLSSSWDLAKEEEKAATPVVFVTPEYADQCVVIHSHCGPTLPMRIIKAFLLLDHERAEGEHKALMDAYGTREDRLATLEAFGTKKFLSSNLVQLNPVRATLKSARERHILE
ncbi:MAG TPA: PhnD/SsuA/transferrin family substrate-binding protein [Planctomycetota bacterium]|nr:PhnD/SsuA/transferrin family substrate-binding protein [Planctomycetota bacterium]